MRLKLVEAETPIIKLKNNIANNILPAFKKLGFDFNIYPKSEGVYVFIYRGVYEPYKYFANLILNSANDEIDIWNDTNSDVYVGDLFATIRLQGNEIPLGVISSRNPESVDYLLQNVNLSEFKPLTPQEQEERKLIPPKKKDSGYGLMTKKEWQNEYHRLVNNSNEIRKQIFAMEEKVLDDALKSNPEYKKAKEKYEEDTENYHAEDRLHTIEANIIQEELGANDKYNALVDELKKQDDYISKVFELKIYPLM